MELKQLIIENKVIVTVIFLIAIAGLYQTGNLQFLQQTFYQGYATLSLSPVELVDYETHIRDKAWLLTVSQNKMSDIIYGSISSDSIKDPTTGEKATKDLTVKITADNQTCNYPLRAERNIYRYDYKIIELGYWDCLWLDYSNAAQECANLGGFLQPHGTKCKLFCALREQEAYSGILLTPSVSFKSTITLTSNGEETSAEINTLSQTEVNFPEDIAYARWVGSLSTGEYCPTLGIPSAVFKNNKWILVNENDLNTYLAKSDNFKTDWEAITSESIAESYINDINYALDMACISEVFKSPLGNLGIPEGSKNDGKVVMNLEKEVAFPLINMYIRADWLGIMMPYGMPEITKLESISFDPKQGYGSIIITAKNIGTAPGSFAAKAVCDYPVSGGNVVYFEPLESGDEGQATISLTAVSTGEEYLRKCTVTVYDRKETGNKDIKDIYVTIKPLEICPNGKERCVGNWRERCETNAWNRIEYCSYDCDYKSNGEVITYCVEAPNGNGNGDDECDYGCSSWDVDCRFRELMCKMEKAVMGTLMFIGLGVGGIIVIWLLFKIATAGPERKGYRPQHFRGPYEMMQHPYERGRDWYRRRR